MTVRNIFAETWDKIRHEGSIILGREEGISLGREEGYLNALFSLVNDGMIPITVAAQKANMSEDEFKARMQTTGTQPKA